MRNVMKEINRLASLKTCKTRAKVLLSDSDLGKTTECVRQTKHIILSYSDTFCNKSI